MIRVAVGLWALASLYAQDPAGPQFKIEGHYAGPISNDLRVRAEPVPQPRSWQGRQVLLRTDGRFTLDVTPGRYRVVVLEWPVNGPLVTKATREVVVSGGDVTGLEILPEVNRVLRVRLRRDPAVPGPGGPVRALVILNPLSMGQGPGKMQTAQTAEDGRVQFADVAPDRYVLMVEQLPEGSYVKAVLADGRDVTATGLDLQSGQAAEVELVVATGGTVVGEVVDANGKGVSGARVSFSLLGITHEEFQLRAKGVKADENGHFRLAGLAPGRYSVGANA